MKAKIYPSYLFRDHDPILDAFDTLHGDSGAKLSNTAADSGVSITTLHNWKRRKTKRPQFATVMAAARALGATGVSFSKGKPHFTNSITGRKTK